MVKHTNPLLVIISGPSGVGKDAILNVMKKSGKPYFFAITATTRPKRPGETDGIDYLFVTREKFEKMIDNGELLEWANVYGNFYGVPKQPIEKALGEGRDAIVKVDIQGAATIKRNAPGAVSIFIAPPSMEDLQRRLSNRKTESKESLDLRLNTAREEMAQQSAFDHVVISYNKQINRAVAEIETIIQEGNPPTPA
ncbi:MAG: guanylate kinase [Dehalococcoidia bacterium]|nr:guanylate kinase [Dehalococcoidia bacterium]